MIEQLMEVLAREEQTPTGLRRTLLKGHSDAWIRSRLDALVKSGHLLRRDEVRGRHTVLHYRASKRRPRIESAKVSFEAKAPNLRALRAKQAQEARALESLLSKANSRIEVIDRDVPFREMPPRLRSRALTRSFERRDIAKLTAEANWR
ncbi:hypothetical protein [Singulisphaera sp. PoT]|uniref:hypothetical protein n=1 Tax=Singulisphaera sp. PoT TaxID=3411797 RepID=UPI003BF541AE